jgi:hypothetical protein
MLASVAARAREWRNTAVNVTNAVGVTDVGW